MSEERMGHAKQHLGMPLDYLDTEQLLSSSHVQLWGGGRWAMAVLLWVVGRETHAF